jgi:3-oxoacyl-[acyl-carrier protein] reductase
MPAIMPPAAGTVRGMDLGLQGRRAAVAAGSAGLGLATARALVAEGVRVAVCGRDETRLARAVDELGSQAVGITADVGERAEAARFVEEAADLLGGLDVLVANAGGPPPGSPATTSLEAYAEAIELNLLSTIALTQAALPHLRATDWGRIVAITSVGVKQPIPMLAASGTARAGATWYLKALSEEVAGDGITVNSVQPGSHDTDRLRSLGRDLDELAQEIPVGFVGDADDFGAVVTFLCSAQARFVTGVSVLVDGGAYRGVG